jgi:hypothetical protein
MIKSDPPKIPYPPNICLPLQLEVKSLFVVGKYHPVREFESNIEVFN